MVKSIAFVVLVVDGLSKKTQNSLLKMNHKVEILTTPDCSSCSTVERMLDEIKVPYEVIDVTEKPEYLQKYPIFTAPGLVIDGKLEFTGIPNRKKLSEKLKNSRIL